MINETFPLWIYLFDVAWLWHYQIRIFECIQDMNYCLDKDGNKLCYFCFRAVYRPSDSDCPLHRSGYSGSRSYLFAQVSSTDWSDRCFSNSPSDTMRSPFSFWLVLGVNNSLAPHKKCHKKTFIKRRKKSSNSS